MFVSFIRTCFSSVAYLPLFITLLVITFAVRIFCRSETDCKLSIKEIKFVHKVVYVNVSKWTFFVAFTIHIRIRLVRQINLLLQSYTLDVGNHDDTIFVHICKELNGKTNCYKLTVKNILYIIHLSLSIYLLCSYFGTEITIYFFPFCFPTNAS